jgi:hypothetical protein
MPRLGDRVKDTVSVGGAGNLTLSGIAPSGFRDFNTVFGLNATFPYAIDDGAGNWETGVGQLTASTTLVRVVVRNSSTGGTAITVAAGATVFCDALESYLERTQRGRNAMMIAGRYLQ